jgi:hypothetical protein
VRAPATIDVVGSTAPGAPRARAGDRLDEALPDDVRVEVKNTAWWGPSPPRSGCDGVVRLVPIREEGDAFPVTGGGDPGAFSTADLLGRRGRELRRGDAVVQRVVDRGGRGDLGADVRRILRTPFR